MMILKIKEEFKEDFTSRAAGEKLRQKILTAKDGITLDFDGLKIASASFFDEGIAKLGEAGWDAERIHSSLNFVNLFRRDKELLISVCSIRGIKLKL